MSDPDFTIEPSSWQRIRYNAELCLTAPDDPETALSIALTYQEMAHILFALEILPRLIPELSDRTFQLFQKVAEIGVAQGFFAGTPEVREFFEIPEDDVDNPENSR
jgi:2-keto-4-pentenoate hydratase